MSDKVLEKVLDFGPLAVIIIVLLYGSYKVINKILDANRQDIDGLANRMNRIEDDDRERMVTTIEKNTKALSDNAEVMQEVKYAIQKCKGQTE